MNKGRRTAIEMLNEKIPPIKEELSSICDGIDLMKDEEDDYRESIPENLMSGTNYINSEECSEKMQEAIDDVQAAIDELDSAMEHLREVIEV